MDWSRKLKVKKVKVEHLL